MVDPTQRSTIRAVPRALYFPPGVYLVRDTLQWSGAALLSSGWNLSERDPACASIEWLRRFD